MVVSLCVTLFICLPFDLGFVAAAEGADSGSEEASLSWDNIYSVLEDEASSGEAEREIVSKPDGMYSGSEGALLS